MLTANKTHSLLHNSMCKQNVIKSEAIYSFIRKK